MRWIIGAALGCFLFFMPILGAQTGKSKSDRPVPIFDATNLRGPTDLEAIWLVHAGDDPDGKKGWARPDFDDSDWIRYDPATSLHDVFPGGNPGVVWYRLHIKVLPSQTGLAFQEYSISSAFHVFSNGVPIFEVGGIDPFVPYTPYAKLLARVPDDQIATGSIVIALRVHNSLTEWTSSNPGFYPTNLTIRPEEAQHDHIELTNIGDNLLLFLDMLIALGMSIAALLLYTADVRRREYLWLFVASFSWVILNTFESALLFRNIPALWLGGLILPDFADTLSLACMYFAFIGKRVGLRLWVFLILSSLLSAYVTADFFAFSTLSAYLGTLLNIPVRILFGVILPVLLFRQWRQGNREAGILLIPLILHQLVAFLGMCIYVLEQTPTFRPLANRLDLLLRATHFGSVAITGSLIANLLSSLALAVIILLRTNRLSRQGAILESELAAAREVQQILLPEKMESIPSFAVESVYLPAQQVGGDFFQLVPTKDDGLLLVVGDVAGKGLPAAMLVSVLVGAIRTIVTYSQNPAEILEQLNERMVGRSNGGFSTALAAYFQSNGLVTIANAGHLSPYLDGEEFELPGALPLGILSGTKYETTHLNFARKSRLTFYSDGVIEAQDENGQLFGFDRGKIASTQAAAAIVEQAKSFGQSDDITVIAVQRTL